VFHDATLDRTTDGTGPVRARTLAELQALDAGYRFTDPRGRAPWRGRNCRVPTLAALLEAFPDVPVNIEIKQEAPAIEHAVLAVLDRFAARPRTLLAAEEASIMTRIRAAAPDVLTSFSTADAVEFVSRLQAGLLGGYRPPGVALQVPPNVGETPVVTPEFVRAAHDLGLEVHVWTINDEAEMERLLDLGVDALMTDLPARGSAVLRARGLRPLS
jgi:glycerophosphoryl diester phosphodiesterase